MRDYQIHITKLNAQQSLLLGDYSMIPDDLYDGQKGVKPGGLGAELKGILGHGEGFRTEEELKKFRQDILTLLLARINTDDLFEDHFDDVQNQWNKRSEKEVIQILAETRLEQKSLDSFLSLLAEVGHYVQEDVNSRLPMFFEFIRSLVQKMLIQIPPYTIENLSQADIHRFSGLSGRGELSQIRREIGELRTHHRELRTHQTMLSDYSKIPDNLYDGKRGIKSNKSFGKALKNILEISLVSRKLKQDELLNEWKIRSENLLHEIDFDCFTKTGWSKFDEDYVKLIQGGNERDFKRLLLQITNEECPLSYYLRTLAEVIIYINYKPEERFFMFFDSVKLLILEMLAQQFSPEI